MNITIFGASGTIGKIVTSIALEKGDNVTAYVRRENSMGNLHGNLTTVVGSLSDQDLIEKAISNADVVISTLGPPLDMSRKIAGSPVANGHEMIMRSMEKLKKKRFITLGTPSIHSVDDKRQLWTILPGIIAKLLFPGGYQEMKKIEGLIKASPLDWTVVRIIDPNGKHTGNGYSFSFGDKPVKRGVSRENVGAFIYNVASDRSFIHKMPIVFNK
jgi:putative NADH-flavin reductase